MVACELRRMRACEKMTSCPASNDKQAGKDCYTEHPGQSLQGLKAEAAVIPHETFFFPPEATDEMGRFKHSHTNTSDHYGNNCEIKHHLE